MPISHRRIRRRERETSMKRFSFVSALLAFLLFAAVASFGEKSKVSQDELMKQATVTREAATKIARDKVPNETIKEAELEKEHGKLVWSFDISSPDSKDITEVQLTQKSARLSQSKRNHRKPRRSNVD
jgi:Peptidase propeptide and YPEB domain